MRLLQQITSAAPEAFYQCVCVFSIRLGSACIRARCVYSESARICGTIRRHASDWSRKCVLTGERCLSAEKVVACVRV